MSKNYLIGVELKKSSCRLLFVVCWLLFAFFMRYPNEYVVESRAMRLEIRYNKM